MFKSYNRNKVPYTLWLFIGLLITFNIFRERTFVVLYDGFFLVCAIITIITGVWGLSTPMAVIRDKTVQIKLSLFSSRTIDLEKVREIGFDKSKQILKFDSFEFRLKWMNSNYRDTFVSDLKKIREQIIGE